MGYDLHITRKLVIERSELQTSKLKGDSSIIFLGETITSLRGWDIAESIIPNYLDSDIQTLEAEDVIQLYKDCCELQQIPIAQRIINILTEDCGDSDVYYELCQSF